MGFAAEEIPEGTTEKTTAIGDAALTGATQTHSVAKPSVWLTDASLALTAAIWGANFSVVKYGTMVLSTNVYNGLRLGLAAIVLVAFVTLSKLPLPNKRDALSLLGLGVIGNGLYQLFFVAGLARTSAGDAALVISAMPAFVAIIAQVRGAERATSRRIAGIVLSMLGIALVIFGATSAKAGSASLTGDLIILGASLCWSAFTVLLQPHVARYHPMVIAMTTMLGGAVPLVLFTLPAIARADLAGLSAMGWFAIAYAGVGSLVIGYAFWYRGIRILGPTRTAMYSNLQPIVAILVAWATLGEVPTVLQAAGAASIIGGLLLTRT